MGIVDDTGDTRNDGAFCVDSSQRNLGGRSNQ